MDEFTDLLESSRRALESLLPAVVDLEPDAALLEAIEAARDRQRFRPEEEQILVHWFGRLLSVRAGLWEVIDELSLSYGEELEQLVRVDQRRAFVFGFAAACLLVRLDRCLVEDVATDRFTQRKLNEGVTRLRIPRKAFTEVWESLADVSGALRLDRAMRHLQRERELIAGMAMDDEVGWLVERIDWLSEPLDPSKVEFLRLAARFAGHAMKRAAASSRQQLFFGFLENTGMVVAELRDQISEKRIGAELKQRIAEILLPGDVLVTRHDLAASNLFLPGFWPHVALYIGSPADRQALGVELDSAIAARWSAEVRTLEALKDGVRFRSLESTLGVDSLVILRPQLSEAELAEALSRVVVHEGKGYCFDFDFFRSDRLVCTEVVYRAYDGVGSISLPLVERAGRPTLSAEDLCDLALDDGPFEVIAIFGAPGCESALVEGAPSRDLLAASYRIPETLS